MSFLTAFVLTQVPDERFARYRIGGDAGERLPERLLRLHGSSAAHEREVREGVRFGRGFGSKIDAEGDRRGGRVPHYYLPN